MSTESIGLDKITSSAQGFNSSASMFQNIAGIEFEMDAHASCAV